MHIRTQSNQLIELPEGSTAKDLATKIHKVDPHQSIVARINGVLRDLSTVLNEGDEVLLIDFDEKEGKEVFWHTSAHVLAQAVLRLFPGAKPTIGPPIEKGFYYDFAELTISDADFEAIEREVQKIIDANYASLRHVLKNKKEAIERFKDNPYKCELIEGFKEGEEISAYAQGEFYDLCRGPHMPSLSKIKAFKILKVSGAYWKGDAKREMLTRIYAISYPDRKQLKEYLHFLEEAKKRDHKVLIVWNRLLDFWRSLHHKAGYIEIKTPQIMSQGLWETSGHWFHYRENMYAFAIEDRHFAIKPMNCPGCMLYYKAHTHSYREFPLRIAEFGHVHRHEASGALSGLFRVRSFHQDDAHLFMRPSDIKAEILQAIGLAEEIYTTFGLAFRLELSTRPEKSMGSDADWEVATAGLKDALDAWGQPYRINAGDGAFYGPKIDIHIQDALNRSWQCGTIQLDMALPEKFALDYMDSDGQLKRPVMLHRALFGSVERFMGILIEHFAGRFPLWISPAQVKIITVAERHAAYAHELAATLEKARLCVTVDDTNETVSKKIRNAQLMQYNYLLTVGDVECENQTVTLRTRDDNKVHGEISPEFFLKTVEKEIAERLLTSPFNA